MVIHCSFDQTFIELLMIIKYMLKKNRKLPLAFSTIFLLFMGLLQPHLNLSVWFNEYFVFDAILKGTTLIVAIILLYYYSNISNSLNFSLAELLFIGFVIFAICLNLVSEFNKSSDAITPKLTYALILYVALKALLMCQSFDMSKVLLYLIVSVFIVESIYIIGQKSNLIFNTNSLFPVGGSFGHPGYSATLLGILILFLFSNFKYFGKNIWLQLVLWSCFLMSFGFSLYAVSRTGILLNLIAFTLYITSLLSKKSTRLAAIGVAVFAITISLAQLKKNSSSGRIFIWKNSLNMLTEMPLLGYGTDSFSSKYNRQQTLYFSGGYGTEKEKFLSDYILEAYNEFIEVTIEMGYLGLLLLTLFIIILLIEEKRAKSDLRTYPLILGYVITMCFWSSFRELPYLLTFFTLIAVAKTVKVKKNRRPRAFLFIAICFFLFIVGFTANNVYDNYQFKKNSAHGDKNWIDSKYENAAKFFQKAIEYKKSQALIVKYTIALNLSGKTNEAVEFLKSISDSYSSPDYLLLLGDLYFQNKNYSLSETYYLEAHYNVPSKFTPLYKLAKAFIHGKKKMEADSLVNIILNTEPKVNSTATIAMKEELRYLIHKMDTTQVKH